MPSKKKKYNARFPAGRIKKIMQTDEEVGKVAQAVPVIISRTLELFVESLLTKTLRVTNARNAKTLSPSHMKQCIISESRFDFLRDLVKNIPDISMAEDLAASDSGFLNEAVSPQSTSSSSNGGNGLFIESNSAPPPIINHLQRSESYTPMSHPINQLYSHPTSQQQQQQIAAAATTAATTNINNNNNSNKRVISHSNSLNFYKEIGSPEDTNSNNDWSTTYNREPPPKLTRLLSAPAASTSTTTSFNFDTPIIPYKIDIIQNLNASSTTTTTTNNNHSSSPQIINANSSTNYQQPIRYPIPSTSKTTPTEPLLKLDYTNLKLPMSMQSPQPPQIPATIASYLQPQQPTIKIDFSQFNTQMTPYSTPPRTPVAVPPPMCTTNYHPPSIMPLSSISNPPSAAIPVTPTNIPTTAGMDEDYDDI